MIQDEIMKLQTYKMFEGDSDIYVERDDVLEVLKQEPCEDCISRQAVIDAITRTSGIRADALKALYDVPPVTPQPKIGRWIDESYYKISEYGEEDTYYTRKCSECFERYDVVFNYCPNCGAKMEVEDNG